MAARRSLRYSGDPGAKRSRNTLGSTNSRKQKAGQKPKRKDVFDFPNTSDVSSMLRELEEEEPYETFDPPLHSTAIYTDDELYKHCVSSTSPATHRGKESRNLNPSENEASGNDSIKLSAKKPRRKLEPISDESDSSEDNVRRSVSIERPRARKPPAAPAAASSSSSPSERPAEQVTPRKTSFPQPSAVEETPAAQSQLKTQKKVRPSPGRRKRPRRGSTHSDASESMHILCLEGKRQSDVMELDVVLSAFERTFLDYKQRVESESCNQAISKFYFKIKGELIRMLKEVQMLKALKRKNTKIISNMEKKRQRLIDVQDELIRLEPQLKQLQTKYDDLKKRKSALKNSKHFLSNLKQLYQDYSNVREEEPKEKEKYDSSSLPALLFKARSILGAEKHLKTINYHLGKLLKQD
ncbi:similar to myeloid leukemia factor 1 interacting protein [Rattus norvegicus]|uniref:Centromere protein U n=2 Tax=Rattus norvegicus TaxID=10116 RepID=CENPU_RAT|nr:centromere protein U [Rattus norvegicus]Q4V8G7.1 RecName: Full=Centromere protein U; Short=CENP-U; AltName: Full=MLF1-interacting protein [Rattus norvegicus]AAH97399.1 Myeloid leukemia factor 1 interacting protein [Rattus norvegicus]EDL78890.1 similar to myeloid leukemia factor 1 interacting protein [Rattus norvegicus]|eukprot:NP_001020844.1 centromere protein U [Rattus norvegicus]